MTSNVRHLSTPKNRPTVADAKCVQRLEEHLKALRKHRDFLADKRAFARGVSLAIPLSDHELPPGLKRGDNSDQYIDRRHYQRGQAGWEVRDQIQHGTLDPTQQSYGFNDGCLPTVGTRIMDGIRAALADEIEATETAITKLGFMVPQDAESA